MKPRSRGRNDRKTGNRDQRFTIKVLTEGKVTEPDYLAQWARRNPKVNIQFADYGMDPLSLVRQARRYRSANMPSQPDGRGLEFDEIWCVFDVDAHHNLSQAITEARDSGIKIAISSPCFELWLILHYQDQTASIGRAHAKSLALQLKALDKNNKKSLNTMELNALLSGYDEARRRAQELSKNHAKNNSASIANPSSSVWKLVDQMRPA